MICDLHCHTKLSDGVMSAAEKNMRTLSADVIAAETFEQKRDARTLLHRREHVLARAQRKQARTHFPRRVHAGERRTDDRLPDRDAAPQVDGRTHHLLQGVYEDSAANIGNYGMLAVATLIYKLY